MDWNSIKTIAIIGVSDNPERDSYKVAKYFLEKGYVIIPVNPNYDKILGLKCFKSLDEIPLEISSKIDMVDIFRKSEFVLPIVENIIKNKCKLEKLKVIWMQYGVQDIDAYEMAKENGFEVVMNSCAMVQHSNKLEFKL